MPYTDIANFRYGLDTRRAELVSIPGTLQTLNNAHINQGGEIEKRKAFVELDMTLNCFGLEGTDAGLLTFGSAAAQGTTAVNILTAVRTGGVDVTITFAALSTAVITGTVTIAGVNASINGTYSATAFTSLNSTTFVFKSAGANVSYGAGGTIVFTPVSLSYQRLLNPQTYNYSLTYSAAWHDMTAVKWSYCYLGQAFVCASYGTAGQGGTYLFKNGTVIPDTVTGFVLPLSGNETIAQQNTEIMSQIQAAMPSGWGTVNWNSSTSNGRTGTFYSPPSVTYSSAVIDTDGSGAIALTDAAGAAAKSPFTYYEFSIDSNTANARMYVEIPETVGSTARTIVGDKIFTTNNTTTSATEMAAAINTYIAAHAAFSGWVADSAVNHILLTNTTTDFLPSLGMKLTQVSGTVTFTDILLNLANTRSGALLTPATGHGTVTVSIDTLVLADRVLDSGTGAGNVTALIAAVNLRQSATGWFAIANPQNTTSFYVFGPQWSDMHASIAYLDYGDTTYGTNAISTAVTSYPYILNGYGNKTNVYVYSNQNNWTAGSTWTITLVSSVGTYTIGYDYLLNRIYTNGFINGDRAYLANGNYFNFSALTDITQWNMSNAATASSVGAGYLPFVNYNTVKDSVQAFSSYQGKLAVFGRYSIQIWQTNANPANFALAQTLSNIGTVAPFSVISLGELDTLFLSDSGIRSLRVRDSSLNAYVADLGSPIDALVQAQLIANTHLGTSCSIVEPLTNRYMCFVPDAAGTAGTLFVLSYYPGNKVTAWSTYSPTRSLNLVQTAFVPLAFKGYLGQVYVRTADSVLIFGGTDGNTFDNCLAKMQTGYLSGGGKQERPGTLKIARSLDYVINGTWALKFGMDWISAALTTVNAAATKSSYDQGSVPVSADGTHFSFYAETTSGLTNGLPPKLSSVMLHYELGQEV